MERYEPFNDRQAGDDLHRFGVRALVFAMHHYVFDDMSIETMSLAIHVSIGMHTAGSTDSITAAVKRLRLAIAERERTNAPTVAAAPVQSARPAPSGGTKVTAQRTPVPRHPTPSTSATPF